MDINDIDDLEQDLLEDDEFYDVEQEDPIDDNSYYGDPEGGYADEEEDELIDNGDEENPEDGSEDNDDIIGKLLKSKGINPESVKIETEDGLTEVPFNELTSDEQLQILQSNDTDDDYGLNAEEIQLINQLRQNNWTVADYNQWVGNEAIKAQAPEEQPQFNVDSISDDELYVINLKERIPTITEDEALAELENAKNNFAIYSKFVESIRNEYKAKEQAVQERQIQEAEAKARQAEEEFTGTVMQAITNNSTIDIGDSAIELSEDDKNELASFILDRDQNGNRYFANLFNDPNSVVQLAWYALKGKEAFKELESYYKKQITEVAKRNYNKGYEDANGGRSANPAKAVVRRNRSKNSAPEKPKNRELTIDDID